MTARASWLIAVLGLAGVGCSRVPNPNYVDEAGGSETATGEGTDELDDDGDLPGDGDGDPTGDGDGEPTGDGDGDTGPICDPGSNNCVCDVLEQCQVGLACVLGVCLDADSCVPVDDAVQVSATPTWAGDPPLAPTEPQVAICKLDGVIQGDKAVLQIQQCTGGSLLALTVEVAPILDPLPELLGDPNLAATVYAVETVAGRFFRIDAHGLDLYYVDANSLFAGDVTNTVTNYPWPIASFSSACGLAPTDCGMVERLALTVDGGITFDGNAAATSAITTTWAETVIDECGALAYELVVLAQ